LYQTCTQGNKSNEHSSYTSDLKLCYYGLPKKEKKGKNMFNLELKIPTYEEWKAQMEKLKKEQPEQAAKYYEQVQKFWQDFFLDTFNKK